MDVRALLAAATAGPAVARDAAVGLAASAGSAAMDAAVTAAGVPGRVLGLLTAAEAAVVEVRALLERVTVVVAGVEDVSAAAAGTVARAEVVADDAAIVVAAAATVAKRAGAVVGGAERVSLGAGTVVADAEKVSLAAAALVGRAADLTDRTEPLLTAYTGPLVQLEPTVRRFAETFQPAEVEALVTLVDKLPELTDALTGEVLPLLTRLEQIAPDLHSLLETVQELGTVMSGLPGVGFLKRRAENDDD